MRALSGLVLAATLAAAGPAAAHGTLPVANTFGWTWDPWITAPLALALGLFAVGAARLARRSRRGAAILQRRTGFFAIGWSVLALALVSPLHQAGEHSFTAHMVEHELMMLAAAPLLVLADPLPLMLWGLPRGVRRGLGGAGRTLGLPALARRLTDPVTATLIQAAALWLWHTPALFDRALASDGWHIAQHLSFVVSALLFWRAVLTRRPYNPGLAALCLFATSVVSGALGAMMAFSQSPWYGPYARLGMAPLGLTPMEDQQLAGLLMWVPGGVVHAAAALAAIAAVLRPSPAVAGAEARHG